MSNIDKRALNQAELESALLELKRISEQPAVSTHYARVLRQHIANMGRRIAELDQRLIEYAGIATREARRVAELEKYRTAFMEWHDKTAWVQNDKRFDVVHPLGKHRADILGEYIKHLEREKDAIEAVALALRDDMRATRTLTVKMPTTKYQWGGGVLNTIDPVDMLEALRKSCAAIGIKLQITE
ncbi:hypothetical protein [Salmonella enterica]|uniref:hypothetical protein n=1 Tax=Salmonella enterica TaxID=28901 RepID=UPI003F3E32D4